MARFILLVFILLSVLAGCSSAELLSEKDASTRTETAKTAEQILKNVPDYSNTLKGVSGKGRALVSEPGNSERVTLLFDANREKSLITVKNRIGIEGGQFLVDSDSILIYDKLNKKAQKISVYNSRVTNINELASVNILDILNYKVDLENVTGQYENKSYYILTMRDGGEVLVNKNTGRISQVTKIAGSQLPYSMIIYEGYAETEGFTLPRKITIFNSDRTSKVALLIQSLSVNPKNINLEINIPKEIPVLRL